MKESKDRPLDGVHLPDKVMIDFGVVLAFFRTKVSENKVEDCCSFKVLLCVGERKG